MNYEHIPEYTTGADQLDTFLQQTTDTAVDNGSVAISGMRDRLWTPRQGEGSVLDFIETDGYDLRNGFVELYGPNNAPHLDTIGTVMPGTYIVVALTPEVTLPAIIAVDQDAGEDQLKLWLWRQPWRSSGLTEDQSEILAAAAQLEAPGVGQHKATRQQTDTEAQHLLSLLSIADNQQALQSWRQGAHGNHSPQFRASGTLPAISKHLLGDQHQVSSLHIRESRGTAHAAIDGRPYTPAHDLRLLWHYNLEAPNAQGVVVGDSTQAIRLVQGAGFLAAHHSIDNIKQVLSGD
jgi:hypothetical protein